MFGPEDFKNKSVVEKLQVIIMAEMGKNPLGSFRNLTMGDRRRFNDRLNAYVRALPEIEWELKLNDDFNRVCSEDLFNEKFRAENNSAGILINNDIIELR